MANEIIHAPYALSVSDLSSSGIEVRNAEFLNRAFGQFPLAAGGCLPYVVAFPGNPHGVKGDWGKGFFYDSTRSVKCPKWMNAYFSLAAFKANKDGIRKRQKELFAALYVVALDDIAETVKDGIKKAQIPFDRITLAPSYLLETSPGNYQAGYFLKEPITEPARIDLLYQDIIAAGLSDPGASGPQTRLMRLPQGWNCKSDPPFCCRLRIWEPDRRYSEDEIRNGLGVTAKRAAVPGKKLANFEGTGRRSKPDAVNSIYVPAPSVNVVLDALKARGLVKREIEPGKYDITCPWCGEHTDAVDSGTAYWAPEKDHPVGSFHCQHGHCAERNISDLLKFLGIEPQDADMKARIRVYAGDINRVVTAAERELARTGVYYQRGGQVVKLARKKNGQLSAEIANESRLLLDLSCLIRWEHYDARSRDFVTIDPTQKCIKAVADGSHHDELPELKGITQQPILAPDGSVRLKEGYDSSTGLYCDFDSQKFAVPDNPTREDALHALGELQNILTEFPFESECDKSAAISAMLTAAVRQQLRLAPMIHVRAHLSGSGKSYLTNIIGAFATPNEISVKSFPKDEDECRKLLIAELMTAPPVICFDNLKTDIYDHVSLCSALTETSISGRILGASKTVEVSTRALILSSGNNVGPVRDMARRVLTIHLNPQEEIPAARTFKNPTLLDDVKKARDRYVSCALIIISAWIKAGRPKDDSLKVLNSFGEWSDLCRCPLIWLGLPDPAQRVFEVMLEDPERELAGRIIDVLWDFFARQPFTVSDIAGKFRFITAVSDEKTAPFEEAGLMTNCSFDRLRCGWWLKRHDGWACGKHRLLKANVGGSKTPHYRIVEMESEI
jgi:hypothetical protein